MRQTKNEATYERRVVVVDEHERAWDLVFGKGPETMEFYSTRLGEKKTRDNRGKTKRKNGSCPKCSRNNGTTKTRPNKKKPRQPNKVNKKPTRNKAVKKPANRPANTKNKAESIANKKKKSNINGSTGAAKKGTKNIGRGGAARAKNTNRTKKTRGGSIRGGNF